MFRSVLASYAEEGKPVLVVIDNVFSRRTGRAADPGRREGVVTSRHKLPLQNAQRLEIDKLSESAGVELLAERTRAGRWHRTRVAAHPAMPRRRPAVRWASARPADRRRTARGSSGPGAVDDG